MQAQEGSSERSSATGASSFGLSGPGLYETWLVLEYCEKGSLHDALQRRRFHRGDGSRRMVRGSFRVRAALRQKLALRWQRIHAPLRSMCSCVDSVFSPFHFLLLPV